MQYVPGWDCHGLPIEVKALQAQKEKGVHNLTPVQIRDVARGLATRTVEQQKAGFKNWGVMGEWENAYRTMDASFEMRQLDVFKKLVENGKRHG